MQVQHLDIRPTNESTFQLHVIIRTCNQALSYDMTNQPLNSSQTLPELACSPSVPQVRVNVVSHTYGDVGETSNGRVTFSSPYH
jgi:hypothetical protein